MKAATNELADRTVVWGSRLTCLLQELGASVEEEKVLLQDELGGLLKTLQRDDAKCPGLWDAVVEYVHDHGQWL